MRDSSVRWSVVDPRQNVVQMITPGSPGLSFYSKKRKKMKHRIYLSVLCILVFAGVLLIPTTEDFKKIDDPVFRYESDVTIDIKPQAIATAPEPEYSPSGGAEGGDSDIQISTPVVKDESNVKLEFSLGKNTKITISFGSISSIVMLWLTYFLPMIKGRFTSKK